MTSRSPSSAATRPAWPASIAVRLGRMALAAVFVRSGYDVVRHPEGRAATATPFFDRVRAAAPVSPLSDVSLVRANAAAQVVAGAALAAGVAPRLAAGVLVGSLVPTTVAGHPYWSFDDAAQRAGQRIHFFKNVGLAGGLLLAMAAPTRRRGPRRRRR